MTAATYEETIYPDGRHELTPETQAAVEHSALYNEDLAPVRLERRVWNTYAYLALWVGMSVNIPSWSLAAGLILIGMDWVQAVVTVMLGNLIVLVPMLLNSHAGTKYGIPFPVFARASFGTVGANLPALLRAGVACGWFGIQTWIGGGAIFVLVGAILGQDSWWVTASTFKLGFGGAQPWTLWLSFAIFWVLNLYIILRGMNTLRIFESWSAPFLIVISLGLTIWMIFQAHGLGDILAAPNKFGGWTGDFWKIFFPSLMGMIAFWSTLSLNMPDFTRFGRSQRDQTIGQALGLPTTMTLFAIFAVLTASASAIVYGEAIWDPVQLVGRFDNVIVIVVALFAVALATLTTNVAANLVSPSYDFSNVFPKLISFRTGGIITAIVGILIQPWYLYSNAEIYIFTWLGFYGGATGAIAGVLIADYWLIRRTELRLADLYRASGIYRYMSGWNWRAVVALLVGIVMAVGGAYSNVNADGSKTGPFPVDGLIPFLKPLYDYSWVVGLAVAFVLYWILVMVAPIGEATTEAAAESAA